MQLVLSHTLPPSLLDACLTQDFVTTMWSELKKQRKGGLAEDDTTLAAQLMRLRSGCGPDTPSHAALQFQAPNKS